LTKNRTEGGTHGSLAQWEKHVEQTFPEVIAILRGHGATWRVDTGVLGLVIVIDHVSDHRFGIALISATTLAGLRGRRYDVSDAGKPSERKQFVEELKRRLAIKGLTRAEVFDGTVGTVRGKRFRAAMRSRSY
jgi:hypothetical protein